MARTALTALMVRRQMAQTVVQLAVTAASQEMAAMAPTVAARILKSRPAVLAALLVISHWVALVAPRLADLAATVATAATAGRLMAAARLVAMAVLAAAQAAGRKGDVAGSGVGGGAGGTVAARRIASRSAGRACLPGCT